MEKKKPLAIGIDDYKRIIEKPYYYVDKTLLIRDILDKSGYVKLFARPRRFGKTLALSMIKTFFEKEIDEKGAVKDNSRYFDGMKIMNAGEEYTSKLGKYPVIFLSLKSAKQRDFEVAFACIREQIAMEYKRHAYLLDKEALLWEEKEIFRAFIGERAEYSRYTTALFFLSYCLKKYHKENVIILLDEYDVPLENAYFRGFYDEMTDFIRSLFESALKTNDNLEFAVMTGCLRISRESIFTGLNNLKVISVLNNSYAEYFGFTQEETDRLIRDYDLEETAEEIKDWYDGYLFGGTKVYNPWSVICRVDDILENNTAFPKPYWANVSSNSIVRDLLERADNAVRTELESLIAGGTIKKQVHEDITYGDIYGTRDNLWNFLLFTGYLTVAGQSFEAGRIYLKMKIPNEEVRYIYQNMIQEWFEEKLKSADFTAFYQAVKSGDCKEMERFLSEKLQESISYYDNAESFYHGYLAGILGGMDGYTLASNKESGGGRPDIVLSPAAAEAPAVIIELKAGKKFTQMETLCDTALSQIKEKNYAAVLEERGYTKILSYGICFCKKTCRVKNGENQGGCDGI